MKNFTNIEKLAKGILTAKTNSTQLKRSNSLNSLTSEDRARCIGLMQIHGNVNILNGIYPNSYLIGGTFTDQPAI